MGECDIDIINDFISRSRITSICEEIYFQIQGPSLDEVWVELEEQPWYQEWVKNDRTKAYLEQSKQNGLLSDPYYVKRVIHHEGTRDGFIEFMEKELIKSKVYF